MNIRPCLFIPLIYMVLGTVGCFRKDSNVIVNFPIIKSLHGKKIEVPVETLGATFLTIVKDKLIVIEPRLSKDIFKVLEIPTTKFKYTSGFHGRGPGEFGRIGSLIRTDSVSFYVRDQYGVKQVLVGDTNIRVGRVNDLGFVNWTLQNFVRLNDSVLIAEPNPFEEASYKDLYRYLVLNSKSGEVIKSFGEFPNESGETLKELLMLYRTSFVYSEFHDRFIGFYFNLNRIEVFNGSGELIRVVELPNSDSLENPSASEGIFYNTAPSSDEENIYTLGMYSQNSGNASTLNIWTWEGDPVAQYNLNPALISFTHSKEHGRIYGITVDNEIYEFDLPN